MLVLDASAMIELVLRSTVGLEVRRHLAAPDISLHAPDLLDVEVVHVLRRLERRGELGTGRAEAARQSAAQLDLERYGHEPLLDRMWQLRHNLTAYDAAYVALAELLDAALLTCDERLARSSGHRVQVVVAGATP